MKILPALVVATVAIVSGIWFANRSADPTSTLNAASSDSDETLEELARANGLEAVNRLTEKLVNASVFPSDYKTVPEFKLIDTNNQPFTQEGLKGKWNLMFFGFTHCPDVCPMTMNVVTDAIEQIKADPSNLPVPQTTFVTVDPKRDTREKLESYIGFFNPEFTALTGDLNNVYQLTNPLNIVVSFTANKEDPDNYTVDHTASILLVDPELKVRGKFNAPHTAEQIVADYQTFMDELNTGPSAANDTQITGAANTTLSLNQ